MSSNIVRTTIVVIVLMAVVAPVHAHCDISVGVGGPGAYTPAPRITVQPVVPVTVCVETASHPCGHVGGGDSVAAACGDPTCGMVDKPELCGGFSPCYFCCCGCEGGCGTGDSEDVVSPCVDGARIVNGRIVECK
jgi:hypothetical protein